MLENLQDEKPKEESKQVEVPGEDEVEKKIDAGLAEVEASVDQLETNLEGVEKMIRDLELKLQN